MLASLYQSRHSHGGQQWAVVAAAQSCFCLVPEGGRAEVLRHARDYLQERRVLLGGRGDIVVPEMLADVFSMPEDIGLQDCGSPGSVGVRRCWRGVDVEQGKPQDAAGCEERNLKGKDAAEGKSEKRKVLGRSGKDILGCGSQAIVLRRQDDTDGQGTKLIVQATEQRCEDALIAQRSGQQNQRRQCKRHGGKLTQQVSVSDCVRYNRGHSQPSRRRCARS